MNGRARRAGFDGVGVPGLRSDQAGSGLQGPVGSIAFSSGVFALHGSPLCCLAISVQDGASAEHRTGRPIA